MDGEGRVYVADTHNFRVQVFSTEGRFVRAWGRQGTAPGEFDHVFGLAVDPTRGVIYAVDDRVKLERGGNRVQVFSLDGRPLGHSTGVFDHPFDLAVGPRGAVFVTERAAGQVRVLDPEGIERKLRRRQPTDRPARPPAHPRRDQPRTDCAPRRRATRLGVGGDPARAWPCGPLSPTPCLVVVGPRDRDKRSIGSPQDSIAAMRLHRLRRAPGPGLDQARVACGESMATYAPRTTVMSQLKPWVSQQFSPR